MIQHSLQLCIAFLFTCTNLLTSCFLLLKRINIEGIKNDAWFQINYVAVRHGVEEEVNLDDIDAVFNDIEVCINSRDWLLSADYAFYGSRTYYLMCLPSIIF